MNKLIALSPVLLVGCTQEQGLSVATKIADGAQTAAPIVAGLNPTVALALQIVGGVVGVAATGYAAYKGTVATGIHKPVLNTASVAVGTAGDLLAVLGKACVNHGADLCQAAEDKLNQD